MAEDIYEKLLQMLQSVVKNKQVVRFSYTNNSGETREHCVEPIAVIYKWYAWYMLTYNTAKQDYRTYKLVRMEDVCITEDEFSKEYKSSQDILNDCDNSYQGKGISTKVRMWCRGNAIHRIKEYLNGQLIEMFDDGSAIMEIHIVTNYDMEVDRIMSIDVYEQIPVMESDKFLLREIEEADAEDLLKYIRIRLPYLFLTVTTA